MLQRCRRLDLDDEAIEAQYRGELRPQDIARELAIVLEIVREIDRRHPARAQITVDAISIGERDGEPVA